MQTDVVATFNKTKLVLRRGDITKEEVDAIVNAANPTLMGGGGVDGAIHSAGGAEILKECKVIRQTQGRCEPGNAVITGAGNLKSRYVVHTVGPIWYGGESNEPETLRRAYTNSLTVAANAGVASVSFPSISTGAFGYPVERAARVALPAVKEFCQQQSTITEIRFVLFDEVTFRAYDEALSEISN